MAPWSFSRNWYGSCLTHLALSLPLSLNLSLSRSLSLSLSLSLSRSLSLSLSASRQPPGRAQIAFFRSLICTGDRRNQAACGTNQGNCVKHICALGRGWRRTECGAASNILWDVSLSFSLSLSLSRSFSLSFSLSHSVSSGQRSCP